MQNKRKVKIQYPEFVNFDFAIFIKMFLATRLLVELISINAECNDLHLERNSYKQITRLVYINEPLLL